jgi:hypothetical protein
MPKTQFQGIKLPEESEKAPYQGAKVGMQPPLHHFEEV